MHSYASDLYALGVIFYELAVGAPPFREVSALEELLDKIESDLPPLVKDGKVVVDDNGKDLVVEIRRVLIISFVFVSDMICMDGLVAWLAFNL